MICLRSESQKHYIFPSNLFFMLRKFPTSSGRRSYKSHKFKTWNTISSENTIDKKLRKILVTKLPIPIPVWNLLITLLGEVNFQPKKNQNNFLHIKEKHMNYLTNLPIF